VELLAVAARAEPDRERLGALRSASTTPGLLSAGGASAAGAIVAPERGVDLVDAAQRGRERLGTQGPTTCDSSRRCV